MIILETDRLQILEFEKSDAQFIFELINEPEWIEYIGDKNVKNVNDAENFITNKLMPSYSENGYGLYVVKLKKTGKPIGMCGLVNRLGLNNTDIGFAYLKKYQRKGFAFESSTAILDYAKNILNLNRVVAITNPNNIASGKLLEKLGLTFDKMIDLSEDGKDICKLFVPISSN